MSFRERRGAPPALQMDDEYTEDEDGKSGGCPYETNVLEMSCDIGDTTFRKGRNGVRGHPKAAPSSSVDDSTSKCLVDVNNLETVGVLGRGCSGTVVKALDRSTDVVYAVKTVHNVYDKAQRHQILTEIQTLYSVDTPWLVGFYGAYFKDQALSLILQYCDRGSLDGLVIQHGAIPERILAHMTFQILSGLQHLKEARHFHRDIKPQNILVTSQGCVKLTDFGLARELSGTFDMAQTFVGTFKYMSPERVQNEPYDFSSDIWGVGLVLLECALAEYPYGDCRSYIDVVQSILESPPPSLPSDSFSAEFQDFLNDCLRKDPVERATTDTLLYSSWLELHDATDGERCAKQVCKWLDSLTL
ncbi:STE/STE7/MEK1 protein kinase [Aphanomyces astaci]|uniref:mitogen-activated protein kinase kinase n=1 Tax=Aphanomyces astaci TaxID=112090 RepID=W4GQV1_APHAT|nr:STE/STE7/MEK1 protein kinase [Aphanomyces astaci]ETV82090.1 STE/STE7/MEK1 protein kinase [Aphanomyces astaci]|eukprot:XP_009828827.1 STE/STE7/MEK1 protein kinase [Aphanomyces astaci]